MARVRKTAELQGGFLHITRQDGCTRSEQTIEIEGEVDQAVAHGCIRLIYTGFKARSGTRFLVKGLVYVDEYTVVDGTRTLIYRGDGSLEIRDAEPLPEECRTAARMRREAESKDREQEAQDSFHDFIIVFLGLILGLGLLFAGGIL